MGTNIRNTISESNPYYISKHSYMMVRHYALQYPEWKKEKAEIETRVRFGFKIDGVKNGSVVSPVEKTVDDMEKYFGRIELVERIAKIAGGDIWEYVLIGVTTECNYDYLRLVKGMPCCRDTYYKMYRKFYWLLQHELFRLLDQPSILQAT